MGPSEQRALFGDFLRVESGAQQADDDELPLSLGHVAHVEMQANRSIHDSGCISPYTFPVHKPVQYSSSGRAVRASLRSLDDGRPEARLRSASRISVEDAHRSVATSLSQKFSNCALPTTSPPGDQTCHNAALWTHRTPEALATATRWAAPRLAASLFSIRRSGFIHPFTKYFACICP